MKVDDEEKALMLLSSLPNYYESLMITLLVWNETLKVVGMIVVLLENEKLKTSNDQSEGSILVARSNHIKSMSRDNNFVRDNSKSSSMPRS